MPAAHQARGRKARLLVALLATCLALVVGPSSASAVSFGMMSGGESAQDPNVWAAIQHSGSTIYRLEINQYFYNSSGWASYDKAFKLAAEHNITILPYFYHRANYSPQFPTQAEWESSAAGSFTWFVYAAVHRYGAGGEFWKAEEGKIPYKPVPAWEVWNEENMAVNNPGGKVVDPVAYAKFLKHTSAAIQTAQKEKTPGLGVPVLFGGLNSQTGKDVVTYLQEAKGNGSLELGSYFNGLSLHPYAGLHGAYTEQGVSGEIEHAHAGLAAYFPSKQIWVTEIGWNEAIPGKNPNQAEGGEGVSAELQSLWLTQSFAWIKANAAALNIQSAIWFLYKDIAGAYGPKSYNGLRKENGEFRVAWYAFEEQTGATRWPTEEWQTGNLGGNIASDPDMSSWGYGRLDVFAKGPKGELLHKFYPSAGTWSSWETISVPGAPELTSGPSAASWGPNRIDLVAKVPGNTVGHWSYNGTSWFYDNLGGNITSDPDINARTYGYLNIFARGTENNLVTKWYAGAWSGWENLGGGLYSGPGAASWNSERIDVVGKAANGTVNHWAWSGKWVLDNLGGNITSDPDISSRGYGHFDIFAKGPSNELTHMWYDGNFSPWGTIPGGPLTSGPGTVSWNGDRIDVVAKASDNSVLYWVWAMAQPPG